MANAIKRLTAARVDSPALEPKLHSDGGNLYLDRKPTSTQSWAFIFRWQGKQVELGLGKAIGAAGPGKVGVTLAEARRKAREGRALLDSKPPIDPRTVWNARPPAPELPTFEEVALKLIAWQEERGLGGKNPKHRAQWRSTLASLPETFRKLAIDKIGPLEVFEALDPIWSKTPETGKRLRGRVHAVWESARGPDDARPNPAAWSAWLKTKLGAPKELGKIDRKTGERVERDHHVAMSYQDIPTFAARLRALDGVPARTLEFLLLTAARSGEARGARWSEIDLDARVWTVSWQRLKTGRKVKKPHRVPLSARAIEILNEMRALSDGGNLVFPGRFASQPMHDGALLDLLRQRLGVTDASVHGFRSSFRNWCGNETSFARELAELSLAHVTAGVEAAYFREDALERRRPLLDAWAAYCASSPIADKANVVPIRKRTRRG